MIERLRIELARHRKTFPARLLAEAAEKYLRAYNNQQTWTVTGNGERLCVETAIRLASGVLLDVGANEGQWAEMALSAAPDRVVHSFEVIPELQLAFERRLGTHPRARLHRVGLGRDDQSFTFQYCAENSGYTSAIGVPAHVVTEPRVAVVEPGDTFLARSGIDEVALLKIDVEGMEMDVLDGFAGSLSSGQIALVQFEHGTHHIITRHLVADFVDRFDAWGYEVGNVYPKSLDRLAIELHERESFEGQNLVAVRRDLADAAFARG